MRPIRYAVPILALLLAGCQTPSKVIEGGAVPSPASPPPSPVCQEVSAGYQSLTSAYRTSIVDMGVGEAADAQKATVDLQTKVIEQGKPVLAEFDSALGILSTAMFHVAEAKKTGGVPTPVQVTAAENARVKAKYEYEMFFHVSCGGSLPSPITATSGPALVEASPDPSKWTPCDPDVSSSADNGCQDYIGDTCDAIHRDKAFATDDATVIAGLVESKWMVDEKRLDACPQFKALWNKAKSAVGNGKHVVGKDIQPGKFKTMDRVNDCYWARLSRSGDILDNQFASAAAEITVTVRKSDDTFESMNCGVWLKVG